MNGEQAASADPNVPEALVQTRWTHRWRGLIPRTRWWLLPALCLLLATILVWSAQRSRGPQITIRFREGHGIRAGDALRYLGIEVGTVTRVELLEQLGGVQLHVGLDPAAARLAREGTRFWIVRPEVSLARMRGLETVVGPKYLAAAPGPDGAPARRSFEGEEVPVSLGEAFQENIRIHFAQGHGLVVGDALRYRGLAVGEVTSLDLKPGGAGVVVHVRLVSSAAWLAREGSQFWVERPRVDFQGIRGLETLVGGRYLTVLPGAADAPQRTEFAGRDTAPVQIDRPAGGLEIVLEAPHRLGVDAGAPLTHRGVEVGKVLSVELAGDAASVEVRAYIAPEYRSLVRANTRFWSTSGVDLRLGVSGLRFTADTLATIVAGGIALATPDDPGLPISMGHRFPLGRASDETEQWQQWQPRLAVGDARLPAGAALPRPQRGRLTWQRRTLGIRRTQQREGWLLVLDDSVLAPLDLLVPPENATESSAELEVAGRRIPVTTAPQPQAHRIARQTLKLDDAQIPRWPPAALRVASQPEDCLVVMGSRQRNLPLPVARLSERDGHWRIDPALPLDADAHGAAVVATQDGAVIGLVLVEGTSRVIAPLTNELLR